MSRRQRFGAAAACAALICLAPHLEAHPILQVYIEGATYDTGTETWVVDSATDAPIRLWAIGNVAGPGGKGDISGVKLSVAFAAGDTPALTIAGWTTGGLGGFTDLTAPGTPSQIGGIHTDGSSPLLSDGSALPDHGIYGAGTHWIEYSLGDMLVSEAESEAGDFIDSFPTPSGNADQFVIDVFEISVTGTDLVHFDLYNSVMAGNHVKVKFAPFSHDGEAGGDGGGGGDDGVVPEPTTLLLLGAGGLMAAGMRRRRRK